MKPLTKTILTVVLVVAVLGVAVAVVSHYNEYQNNKQQESTVQAQKEADERQALEARVNTLEAAYDRERIECEKGRAAHDSLTPFAKSKTPAPVCGPAVLQ